MLSKLEPLHYNKQVDQKLEHAMFNDEDSEMRDAAYDALVRLARVKESNVTESG